MTIIYVITVVWVITNTFYSFVMNVTSTAVMSIATRRWMVSFLREIGFVYIVEIDIREEEEELIELTIQSISKNNLQIV